MGRRKPLKCVRERCLPIQTINVKFAKLRQKVELGDRLAQSTFISIETEIRPQSRRFEGRD